MGYRTIQTAAGGVNCINPKAEFSMDLKDNLMLPVATPSSAFSTHIGDAPE